MLQVNYDDAVAQIEALGIILDKPLRFDARSQRWKIEDGDRERRGWTRLREWTSNAGNTYLVGHFGIWRGNDPCTVKIELPKRADDRPVLSPDEIAAIRAAQKEAAKRIEAERKAEAQTAGRWAAAVWHQCAPATEHEYLTRKQIQAHGLRVLGEVAGASFEGVDESNWWRIGQAAGALVVPMHDPKGNVCGLQFIYPKGHARRAKIERDKEFWPSGMAMGGTFGVIGHLRRNGVLLIAEGYATAASLHEATGQSVAYAFSANNLIKAGKQIRRAYPSLKLLFCADDDYLTDGNPGVKAATEATAALEQAAWVKPDFVQQGVDLRGGKKFTDFNDLHVLTGTLPTLAAQINGALDALQWRDAAPLAAGAPDIGGAGEAMPPRLTIDDAARRYWLTYGMGGKVLFDEVERRLVHKDDVLNLLPSHGWDELKKHPGWRVARENEIGFDPTEKDPAIRCNLFGGWPTVPRPGKCSALLGLLYHLCCNEDKPREAYEWIVKWLAYPLQHRGAKMHSAIVVHGMQGVGKSRFFEVYGKIFGGYSQVLGQEALEDKFNSDWAEKKLFILADEVLAKAEMYHVKNRLKGYITGETIRVRAMHVGGRTEKNHMNIVFLSNEKMPVVLENDDRRHCVLYVPPPPDAEFMAEVNEEIDNDGVAALHDYLLKVDLGEFKPWSRPPMTQAKRDLIELSAGSEERFMSEWQQLELEGRNGEILPFCPCLGSHLYRVYEDWCKRQGEFRPRPANHFINYIGKQAGWVAGKPVTTWTSLIDSKPKSRKMVVPSDTAIAAASSINQIQREVALDRFSGKAEWMAACYFAFEKAAGLAQ